jgi:hypothetical protein
MNARWDSAGFSVRDSPGSGAASPANAGKRRKVLRMGNIVGEIARRTKRLRKAESEALGRHEKICSWNTKTGFSVNFPITGTCRPTAVCAKVCYGARAGRPITWDKALRKYIRVHRYFQEASPEEIADRIHKEYAGRKMTFLRWNGVGDLFRESVEVINRIAVRHPEMVLWIATRIPEMARLVTRESESIYLQFSLDASPECRRRKAIIARSRHPRLYHSFLRMSMDEDTMGARIVYNAQQRKQDLQVDDSRTVCPVDGGLMPIEGACEKCRLCFSPRALDGTKHGVR